MLDLIIKNGQCYIEGELKNVDVAVKDGKIEKIGEISEKANEGSIFIISSRVSRVSVMPETMTSIDNNNVLPAGVLNPQKAAILLSLGLKENLKAFELVKFLKLLEIQ